MYNGLMHAHSGMRWIIVIVLVLSFLVALIKWLSKSQSDTGLKPLSLITMISAHIQLLVGLILYFISPKVVLSTVAFKDTVMRFFTLEHSLIMLIAITLITIGHSSAKKKTGVSKSKTLSIYFGLALLLILYMIPWPGQGFGVGWF